MKRSLFIAIVVLLMAALFVSCNADKAVEDQLFEVTIDGGARALQATAEFDVDIEQYYWFYTATKTSGGFRTGEKTVETAVQTTAGLKGANLGSFSKGTWEFSFFGYADPADKGTAAKRVFFQAGLQQTVNSAVSLAITLTRGEGALPAAKVVFDNPTWYHADFAILPANQTTGYALELKVFVGDSTEAWKTVSATTVDGKATFQFAATDALTLTEATTLKFRVYWGEDLVGSEDLAIAAEGATTYTVKDLNDLSGITPVDEQYGVIIFDASVPGLEATTATGSISVSPQDTTVVKAGVAPVSTKQTTVTFPAGNFDETGTHQLTIAIEDTASVSSFSIANGVSAISVISFTLDNGSATFAEPVVIETYIEAGLSGVSVVYNGEGDDPENVDYDPVSGKLTFTTTHFSEFVIVADVAKIGNTTYATVEAALEAAPSNATEATTIVLLRDATTGTLAINGGKNIVLDLGGNALTSAFTYVLNGSLTVKNGTINSIDVYGLDTDDSGMTSSLTIAADAVVDDAYSIVLHEYPSTKVGYDAIIDVNGTLTGWLWVMGNITGDSGDCVININDGAQTANIALQGYAILNINEGATVTGPATEDASAIEVRSGVLNVNGGVIECLYPEFGKSSNNNGTSTWGAGIGISQYNNNTITVNLNGGEASGCIGLYWVDTTGATQNKKTTVVVPYVGDYTSFVGTEEDVIIENVIYDGWNEAEDCEMVEFNTFDNWVTAYGMMGFEGSGF